MPAPSWPPSPDLFPDAELVFVQLLQPLVVEGSVDTETPPDLGERLDFIRVRRIGGHDDGWNDFPLMDVDVYSDKRASGSQLAEKVRQVVTAPHPLVVPAGIVDGAFTRTAPIEVLRHSDTVRHWTATYAAVLRRNY